MGKLILNSYGGNSFAAQRVKRSGVTIYVTTINIESLVTMMPEPDPKQRAQNNRFVDEKHAESFGEYWFHHSDSWVVPPIAVTTTGTFDFQVFEEIQGTENQIGILTLPVSFKNMVEILDGQHRILGFIKIYRKIIENKKRCENQLIDFKKDFKLNSNDFNLSSQISNCEENLTKWNDAMRRINLESVTLEIYSELSTSLQKKFFVTVAKNALGINNSVTTLLDDTKIATLTRTISANDIVLSKITNIDTKKNKRKNEVFKLEDISNIIKIILFGFDGSKTLTEMMDRQIDITTSEKVTQEFFNILQSYINEYKVLAFSTKTSDVESLVKLNKVNTIAFSTPLLRALAHSYFKNVIVKNGSSYILDPVGKKQFEVGIQALDFNISNGKLNNFWYETGHAQIGKKMLESKNQDLKGLSVKLADLMSVAGLSIRLANKNAKIVAGKLVIN